MSNTETERTKALRNIGPSSIVTVDNVPAEDVMSLKVCVDSVQSGSGDPSPTNVRPISGWTGAKVTRCGKNFLEIDNAWIGRSGVHNGITWQFNEDGSMTLNGTKTTSTPSILIWNFANAALGRNPQSDNKKHIPNGDYFIYSGHGEATVQVFGSNDENADTNNSYYIASGNLNPVRFTINDTYKYNWIRLNIAGSAVFDNYTFYPMIQLASDTSTEQTPYTGATYDITFPTEAGTVYGGTLDVTTGLLTVDRAIATKNNFEYEGTSAAGLPYFNYFPTNYKMNKDTAISTHYKYIDGDPAWVSTVPCFSENLKRIRVYNDTNTLPDNLEVVYELATPQTYQLTPTQIALLEGVNNVWADCGDILKMRYWSYDLLLNKVVFDNNTLIDLTGDTVTSEVMLAGYTAHDATGSEIEGSIEIATMAEVQTYFGLS